MKKLVFVSVFLSLFSLNSFAEWKLIRNPQFGNRIEIANFDRFDTGTLERVYLATVSLNFEFRDELIDRNKKDYDGNPIRYAHPLHSAAFEEAKSLGSLVGLSPNIYSSPSRFLTVYIPSRGKNGASAMMLIKSLGLIDKTIPETLLEQFAEQVSNEYNYQALKDPAFPENFKKFSEAQKYLQEVQQYMENSNQ